MFVKKVRMPGLERLSIPTPGGRVVSKAVGEEGRGKYCSRRIRRLRT